jgi:hypothetical protein
MKRDKKQSENPIENYNPTARNFQRTDEDANEIKSTSGTPESDDENTTDAYKRPENLHASLHDKKPPKGNKAKGE